MDKVSVYLKKIVAFGLSAAFVLLLLRILPYWLAFPSGFLLFAFLIFRITETPPPFLFGLRASDTYLSAKGGFWLLFKWLTFFPGLAYDIVLWVLHGVYETFILFTDIFYLLKIIGFWILHAMLWVLKLFVPPIVLIYKIFLHYLVFWPWWIYRISFRNMGHAIGKASWLIALRGSVAGIFILMVFAGTARLVGAGFIVIPGIVLALLPMVWAAAEIASLRERNALELTYRDAKKGFGKGMLAVRGVLFYVIAVFALLTMEILFNLFGWIPEAGLSLLGVSLNINTLFSIGILFLGIILLFAATILPVSVVKGEAGQGDLPSSVQFLEIIGRKFLRYIASLVPSAIFSPFLLFIPALVIGISVLFTLNLKDKVIDSGIARLEARKYSVAGHEKHILSRKLENLAYFREFPQNVTEDFENIKNLRLTRNDLSRNIEEAGRRLETMEKAFRSESDSLKKMIQFETDSFRIKLLNERLDDRTSAFGSWRDDTMLSIQNMKYDDGFYFQRMVQLPIAFLLIAMWLALFGGGVVAVLTSYKAHINYELYNYREDGKPVYLRQVAEEINNRDRKQPLLGFTLLFLLIVGYFVLSATTNLLF